jgi:hypothetical protein
MLGASYVPDDKSAYPRKISWKVGETVVSIQANSRNQVEATAQNAKREAIPWVVGLARFGYAAKGVVYFVVGILALQVALGTGGQTTGTEGAVSSLARQPFGQVMLAIVAVGLLGYALWRYVQAWFDPEDAGDDAQGIGQRLAYVLSGTSYALLAFFAAQILLGSGGGGGGNEQTQDWTARLMSLPFGRWLVALIGLGIIGVGLYQMYYGYKSKFHDHLKLHEMSETEITWATRSGSFGYIARGVVYAIIGGFVITAAWQFDPEEVGGMGKALSELARQPYGPWLLGAVALGLIAYSLFAFVEARYRRIFIT